MPYVLSQSKIPTPFDIQASKLRNQQPENLKCFGVRIGENKVSELGKSCQRLAILYEAQHSLPPVANATVLFCILGGLRRQYLLSFHATPQSWALIHTNQHTGCLDYSVSGLTFFEFERGDGFTGYRGRDLNAWCNFQSYHGADWPLFNGCNFA